MPFLIFVIVVGVIFIGGLMIENVSARRFERSVHVSDMRLISVDGRPVDYEIKSAFDCGFEIRGGYREVDVGSNYYNGLHNQACYSAFINGQRAVFVTSRAIYFGSYTETKGFWVNAPESRTVGTWDGEMKVVSDVIPEKILNVVYARDVCAFHKNICDHVFRKYVKSSFCIKDKA